MNIAMMVRGFILVPRPPDMIYAPIDLAYALAKGLSERGHKIDFYAPLGSSVEGANIRTCNLRPLATNQEEFQNLISNPALMTHYIPAMWDSYMADEMFVRANAGKYDLLHFHHPESALPHARINGDVPVIYTLHDPTYDWFKELYDLYQTSNQHFISISNNQRRDAPDLPYAATVYNGIDPDDYPFSEEAEDYLLFSGRIIPEKGVKEAVQIAKKLKHRLLIIGSITPDNQTYFDQHIKPHLDDQILYLGYIERDQLSKYYKKAKALLTPVQWEEPFGLATIEAMASGTPVISLKKGAASELIINGKTGYVVESIAEMIESVQKISDIKRKACRKHATENFSIEKMVDGYETTFEQVLRDRKKLSRQFVRTKITKVPQKLRGSTQKRHHKKMNKIAKKAQ
ncbi:glycosyltransferase family 4 protein [Candidatus Saccharibacteria bacterium]|nr:glycosyltransferase family 4 protein [Candidatus Saccharibacteria bacterium]